MGWAARSRPFWTRLVNTIDANRLQKVNAVAIPANPDEDQINPDVPGAAPGKRLSPEARRALEEAAERRKLATDQDLAPEINGPKGEEPTRFGDWERKGLAVDF